KACGRIHALDVAGRNQVHVRRTCNGTLVHSNELRCAVLELRMLGVIVLIGLYDLAEVYIRSKRFLYCLNIGAKGIVGNLHAIGEPSRKIVNKRFGCSRIALSDLEGWD